MSAWLGTEEEQDWPRLARWAARLAGAIAVLLTLGHAAAPQTASGAPRPRPCSRTRFLSDVFLFSAASLLCQWWLSFSSAMPRLIAAALVVAVTLGGVACGSRPVDRYNFYWSSVGSGTGFGSPYVGNGDIGVALGAPAPAGKGAKAVGALLFGLGKNDFWTSDDSTYFNHNAGPSLTVALPAGSYNATALQNLGAASLTGTLMALDGSVSLATETIVGESGTNAVITNLLCNSAAATCQVAITLRDCCGNNARLGETMGGNRTGLWFRKENVHNPLNFARMASCSPDTVLYSVQRQFLVDPATSVLTMANGSCPWVLDPASPASSPITTGNCSSPNGRWVFQSNSQVSLSSQLLLPPSSFSLPQKQSEKEKKERKFNEKGIKQEPDEKVTLRLTCGWV
jgi:hypothetical protein